MAAKVLFYEVYTSNPETGENGWNIEFYGVLASNREEAETKLIKSVPNFDCIILHDRTCVWTDLTPTQKQNIHNFGYCERL